MAMPDQLLYGLHSGTVGAEAGNRPRSRNVRSNIMTRITGQPVKPQPLTDAELERLSGVLGRFDNKHPMNLEHLDGFFAALICGPKTTFGSISAPRSCTRMAKASTSSSRRSPSTARSCCAHQRRKLRSRPNSRPKRPSGDPPAAKNNSSLNFQARQSPTPQTQPRHSRARGFSLSD